MKNDKELLEEAMWLIGFLKEDICMDRYSKEKNIKSIENIQDKLNEYYKKLSR